MKYKVFFTFLLLIIYTDVNSQAPQGFTYQAVPRNATGEIMTNQDISFRISLLQGDVEGITVFQEKHFAQTNSFGLVTLIIGQGLEPLGNFSSISWDSGPYFLKIEFDANGGNNYTLMGINELLSVPYALYAETSGYGSGSLPGVVTDEAIEVTAREAKLTGQVISDGGEVVLLKGFCWATTPQPTTADTIKGNGVGKGPLSVNLSALNDATTYFVRAFATNRTGTSYGNEISFTTMPLTGTVADIDGNVYATIMIGTQIWMAENLRTTRYRNADVLPGNLTNTQWSAATSGAYAYPNNDIAWNEVYGKLYNWYAIADTNGLCPEGWRIPEDEDWADLLTYLEGNLVAGGKLKSTRTVPDPHPRWDSPNTEATNESGFSGYPPGDRFTSGLFYNFGKIGTFWSSTQANTANAWSRGLSYASAGVTRNSNDKRYGFSVRCLKITEEK